MNTDTKATALKMKPTLSGGDNASGSGNPTAGSSSTPNAPNTSDQTPSGSYTVSHYEEMFKEHNRIITKQTTILKEGCDRFLIQFQEAQNNPQSLLLRDRAIRARELISDRIDSIETQDLIRKNLYNWARMDHPNESFKARLEHTATEIQRLNAARDIAYDSEYDL